MLNVKLVTSLVTCSLLTACASQPTKAPSPTANTKLVLILVGGNSESLNSGGIWKLYEGREKARDGHLISSIQKYTGLASDQIATYYYSWTGDDEDQRNSFLPGHWNWIFGGAARIKKSLESVLAARSNNMQLAIVGWSNGGATAYELACTLEAQQQLNLLVTLDPVAWSTKPCPYYSAGKLDTPSNWIDVYTESGLTSRLNAGNIIALVGRAWDSDKLPSTPVSIHKLAPANHGDTKDMWDKKVTHNEVFYNWASSLKP